MPTGRIDRRADVFAFGVVLWELIARRALFQGDAAAVLGRIVNHDVESTRNVRADAPAELDRIALKALKRDPADRYASADAMRLEIEAYLHAQGDQGLDAELSKLLTDTFTQTRDEVRARIKAFLEKLPPDEANEGSSPQIGRTRDLPTLVEGTGSHTPPATSGIAPVMEKRRNGWPWLVAAVAVSIGGVVLLARLGRQIQPATGAAAAAAATEAGHVRLSSNPPGAVIERDGKPLSTTPASLDLEPGTVTLRVSLPGYEAETLSIDVAPGSAIDRAIVLRATAPGPAPAMVSSAHAAVAAANPTAANNGAAAMPHAASHVAPAAPPAPAPSPAASAAPKPSASAHPHLNIRVLDE